MDQHGETTRELTAAEVRRPLTVIQRERMLAILLRNKDAFARAVEQLSPARFPFEDRPYSVAWAVAVEHWNRFKDVPSRDDMVTECRSRLQQSPGELMPDQVSVLQEFIKKVYRASSENMSAGVGLSYLQRWLEELLLQDCRTQMAGTQPRDAFKFLSNYTGRAANLSTLTDPGIADPFPDGWDTSGRVTTPLDVGPIDHFLGGGYAAGEVYVILGPVGSCKSLTGVQVSINIAGIERGRWNARGRSGPIGLSYLFYYEGGEDEFRQRAIVYSARISRDVVCGGNLRQRLKKAGEPRNEYELREFALQIQQGNPPESEYDRFLGAMRDLSVNWRPIAMKPTQASPGRGGGSHQEILQLIEDDLARQKQAGVDAFCAGVVVDYLGIMIERHIQLNSLDRDASYRPMLVRSPLFFKNSVAERFGCPVFLMHQLNAKGNSLSSTQLPKLTDSEGSNMLAENADFGIVIGRPQPSDYTCLMGCEKARHAARRPPVIFQINGEMGYISMPQEAKVVDPNSKQLVDVSQVHRIVRVENQQPKPRQVLSHAERNRAVYGDD